MIMALRQGLRGLPDPVRSRRCRATTIEGHPGQADQVNGAGFRPDEIAKLPVPGPFKYESVTPQAELRLAKNDNYANPRTGKPANLDCVVFKWYGDPDAMIAGFRNSEIDVAFDLQDSDLPKVQDLGDQVAAIPALLYEFLRPNWSPGPFTTDGPNKNTGGCSRNPAVQDRGTGCPTADPAIRQAIAYAIDKNEINTRLLGGNAQVANTNISPSAWFYADQPPATFDPDKAKQILADGGWADSDGDGIVEKDGTKAKIELCTTTRQVRQDTLALISSWLKDVGIDSVINPVVAVGHLRRLQRGDASTPRAPSRAATSTSLSTRSAPRSTRWATTPATTAASSARRAPTTPRSATRTSTRPSTTSRTTSTSRSIKDAMAHLPEGSTSRRPSRSRCTTARTSSSPTRGVGNYFANGTQVGSDLERRGLVRPTSSRGFTHRRERRRGARHSGRPVAALQQRGRSPWVYCPRKPSERACRPVRPVSNRTAPG